MRPPRWTPWTPPPPPRDIHKFRLPAVPLLLLSGETPDQEKNRRRAVRREAYRFYQIVSEHLGEEDAKELFGVFISNPRRGTPSGSSDFELKARLLAEHDKRRANALRYKSKGNRNIVAKVAHDLASEFGKKPGALRKALDRHLAERAKQQRRRALWETRRGVRPESKVTLLEPYNSEDSDTNSEK
jgi:hypothetical protein